jgi:hypothetical protein
VTPTNGEGHLRHTQADADVRHYTGGNTSYNTLPEAEEPCANDSMFKLQCQLHHVANHNMRLWRGMILAVAAYGALRVVGAHPEL